VSAEIFLYERLDVEQESAMSCMKSILTRKTNVAFIENGKVLLFHVFSEDIGTFAEEVCVSRIYMPVLDTPLATVATLRATVATDSS